MSLFGDKTLIGLDIGTQAIKMAEITKKGDERVLNTYAIASHNLPIEGYWDGSRLSQFSRIIQDLLDQGNFSGIKTVVGVHSQDVYVTTMDFESRLNKHEIKREINKQAPYFLPYPPDEMRLSWSVIKMPAEIVKQTGKKRVIVTALPDFVIENSRNLLEHVDLDGVALENQTVSQVRASLWRDQGTTILVDVGANLTTLSVLVDGVLRASSHIGLGSHDVTRELMNELGLDEDVADSFKINLNLVNLYKLPTQVSDFLNNLRVEVHHYWELNQKSAQVADKVVFTGGGVMTPGFLSIFRQNFPVPVYLADALSRIKYNPVLKPYLLPVSNQLSSAIGLASKEI